MQRLATSFAAGVFAVAAAAQNTLVIPNGYATAEGSTSNAFPWGRTGIGLRHQAIYDSTHFTLQGVTSPITILQLKWRPNGGVALVPSSYTAGCSVFLSTCPVDQAAVTANFASNRGADYQQVFSGPVSWNAQAAVPGPTPFGIVIPLQAPFLYDPSLGDLNIECDLPIQTFTGQGVQLDVESGATTARASRVFMSTGYPTGSVLMTLSHAVVVEVTYAPASGYALSTTYGTGCVNTPDASTYELFATAPTFDLANSAISMIHTQDGYLALPGFTTFVPPSAAATPLALTDDSEVTVALGGTMPVGRTSTTTQLTVCSNGFISAATGNGVNFNPVAATFLNAPQMWWSLAWHDFDPGIAGSGAVKYEVAGGIAYVTWDGVWDYSGTSAANANTMQAQFEIATGNVHFVYLTMSSLGGTGFLTGVSDAGGSADPGSMNISAALPATYFASTFAQPPLAHASSARPVLGTTINLVTTNIPTAGLIGLDILGVSQFLPGIDLTGLGMPTCSLYTSLDATPSFVPAAGAGFVALPIPNNPLLAGQFVYSQGAAFAPGINPFGFVTSNGVKLKLDVN